MGRFNADKRRLRHKYTDVYGMLFDHFRLQVETLLEVGVADGRSLKGWHEFFPHASVLGIDLFYRDEFRRRHAELKPFERVSIVKANSQSNSSLEQSFFKPNTIDIIIDDGDHDLAGQERTLSVLWPLLRPGGYYIIEDVEWDRDLRLAAYPLLHSPERLQPWTRHILSSNAAVFVDPTLGHEAWQRECDRATRHYCINRFQHCSHLVVVRKSETVKGSQHAPVRSTRRLASSKHVLDHVMQVHRVDRSRRHHKFVDLYTMLLEPISQSVRVVVEVGMGSGSSLLAWHSYFLAAEIHALISSSSVSVEETGQLPEPFSRIHRHRFDLEAGAGALGLRPGTADIVIDASAGDLADRERTLHVLWPLLKPHGIYLMEALGWERRGDRRVYPMLHRPERLRPRTLEILRASEAFWADTTLGHPPNFPWRSSNGTSRRGTSRHSHNSHVVVIRKPLAQCG